MLINLFKSSFAELKKTKTIVICGLLLALSLVLNSQSLKIGDITIITFSFIANSVAGFLFGPVPAALLGGLTDALGHVIAPKGAYFFGYTLNAILGGVLYGLFLYKAQWGSKNLPIRIIFCRIMISLFVNLGLGTLWTSMYTETPYLALLVPRATKEIFDLPIRCLVMYIILTAINKYYYILNLDKK